MKLFNIIGCPLIIKVDNKGLRIEETNKAKGRRSLWLLTYKYNESDNKYMFRLEYRWQTAPIWYDTLAEAKRFLEEEIKTNMLEDAFELYTSYILSKIIIKKV